MANLAEFESAPVGTERRPSSTGNWVTASIGDILGDGAESRNTLGNNYQVRLYGDAGMFFNSPAVVILSNLVGVVKVKPAGDADWMPATDGVQLTVMAVGTGPGGGGSVVSSFQGMVRPKPWP